MSSIRLLFSQSYNPWFNLSVEEYIFKNMPKAQSILFLWRNQNTVVIGRAQNAWKECNTRRMQRDGIRLARRHSGGGAVFHDLGNTCFTFMSTHEHYDKNLSTNIIINSLNYLGFKPKISGRNDLIVHTNLGERKISGSAYRKTSNGILHHGTLLLDVDINKLTYYLNPDLKKLQCKGISSICSRIINLQELQPDINHNKICDALTLEFFKYHNMQTEAEFLSMENFSNIPNFIEQFNKQSTWDWNFGNTPIFTHQLENRFNWGGVTLNFNIEHGRIINSHIFTDSLDPLPLEELSKNLIGVTYNTINVQNLCNKWIKKWPKYTELLDVCYWLIKNIS